MANPWTAAPWAWFRDRAFAAPGRTAQGFALDQKISLCHNPHYRLAGVVVKSFFRTDPQNGISSDFNAGSFGSNM